MRTIRKVDRTGQRCPSGLNGLGRLGVPGVVGVLTAVALLGTAAPAAAQQPCGGYYTIRSGDNLTEIASRCGVTVPAIVAANPALRSGAELEVGGTVRIPLTSEPQPTPLEACGAFYTLRPGDAIADVAARCGLTVPLLLAVNPMLENPRNARPGGKVRIPDLPVPGMYEPFVVVGAEAAAADEPAADTAQPDPEPYVRYEGVLQREGQCIKLRTADGEQVGIVGGLGPGFKPGDRVAVTGPAVEATEPSDCAAERAVQVRIMWRPRI